MRIFSLAFLLGIIFLVNFSYLPSLYWIFFLIPLGMACLYLKGGRFFSGCLFGFIWCLLFSHAHLHWKLPSTMEGKTLLATGYIASIPTSDSQLTTFNFAVEKLQLGNQLITGKTLVHLNWRHAKYENLAKKLHVGDQWQLPIRLKKVYSTFNPGGFDYEAHAFEEGIRATGYVLPKEENKLLSASHYLYGLSRFREYVKEKIENHLPVTQTSPWIVALVVGERNNISEANWEILRNTGTNHLMAIGGLHVGIVSGIIYCVMSWAWRRSSLLMLTWPAQQAASLAALSMAFIYSALAGFSLPTQRACIMLCVFLGMGLVRRKIFSWQAFCLALLIVLLLNPLCVLTDSFWLSFGAVGLIIYGVSGRLSPSGLWWKWGRIQWVIAIGLIPLSMGLFQQFSVISFIANSIAIPWVGFLVVPLSLLGAFLLLFSVKAGSLLLILADKILGWLWVILTWFSHLPWGVWHQAMPNPVVLVITCIAVIILLCPSGFPGRYLGLVGLLPLFFYKMPAPETGEINFTLLDVGQGLSAVVRTQHHVLVFDAGAKLGPNYDMGESVVVPFLYSQGIKHIDMLVVSHGDNDHIGGAPAILNHFPVHTIKSSVLDERLTHSVNFCLQGEKWRWDGVDFQFLYPAKEDLGLDNDSSCVLRIANAKHAILLTGDIEKYAENKLLSTTPDFLPADIVVAPHHGSKTSGVTAFLAQIHPNYVLFPIGYRNRYHFPHPIILEKYTQLGAIKINTVESGTIRFNLPETNELSQPKLYRVTHRHYWNNG